MTVSGSLIQAFPFWLKPLVTPLATMHLFHKNVFLICWFCACNQSWAPQVFF